MLKNLLLFFFALLFVLSPRSAPPLFGEELHESGTALKTIVIDPGHGGTDIGAVGPTGALEKDVNLAIAKKLAALLSKKPGLNVILTREDDRFIALTDRTAIANDRGADIFIIIHTNASLSKTASGTETYFMSFEASDDEARRLAAFENGVAELGETPVENQGAVDNLQLIFWDMQQTEFLNESSLLAEITQDNLRKVMKSDARGIKQAPFVVLIGALMPAILVEVGFITNTAEEKLITQAATQEKIAASLFKSISNFEKMIAATWGI